MMGSSSDLGSSDAFAVTCTEPLASSVALCPTLALVSMPLMMFTATATPTTAPLLVLTAAPPVTFWISFLLWATTSISPAVAVNCARAPTVAVVSSSR